MNVISVFFITDMMKNKFCSFSLCSFYYVVTYHTVGTFCNVVDYTCKRLSFDRISGRSDFPMSE